MRQRYSNLNRHDMFDTLQSKQLDLLIIGGGITGAGILLDATVRKMTAGLVEMQDFAAGTSSRSTKLVHGGLRYLKQFEVSLVAEVARERAIVYENAPHVTTPEWMMLPIIKKGTYGKLATSLGIRLYDFLAGVTKSERRQMLNIRQTLEIEPLLNRDIVQGSGRYVEYRTDDARLTLEVLKEAVSRGALGLNYAKVINLLFDNDKVIGVTVRDEICGETYDIHARKIINATGPWVDKLREMDMFENRNTLHLTKGVHIVVDREKFPLNNPIYFDVSDGRMIFAIPRDGKVYVGTTDTNYDGDLEHPRMTQSDLTYLLSAVNDMFPSIRLSADDVESSWAGIRPLLHEEGKAPSEISRKDEIFQSDSGLITIAGGKLTGYRKMAENVVNLVSNELSRETGASYPGCTTQHLPLSGGHVGGGEGFKSFMQEQIKRGEELELSLTVATKLAHRYGSNIPLIYDILQARKGESESAGLPPEVFAELVYSIEFEMVYTPEDFFTRRTCSTYFDIAWACKWKEPVTRYLGHVFGWDDAEISRQLNSFETRLQEVVAVYG